MGLENMMHGSVPSEETPATANPGTKFEAAMQEVAGTDQELNPAEREAFLGMIEDIYEETLIKRFLENGNDQQEAEAFALKHVHELIDSFLDAERRRQLSEKNLTEHRKVVDEVEDFRYGARPDTTQRM